VSVFFGAFGAGLEGWGASGGRVRGGSGSDMVDVVESKEELVK
jgi:hypothetical protein